MLMFRPSFIYIPMFVNKKTIVDTVVQDGPIK